MPWQRTGTVTVTKGSVTVTGVGTEFSSKSRVGDMFSGPDGFPYEVSNIASETVLTIVPAYKGNTAAGQGYILVPVQGYTKTAVDGLNRLMNLAGDAIEQVPNKQPKSENLTWLSGAVPTPNGVVTFNPTGKGIVTRPPSDFVMKGDLGIGGLTTTRLPADNANQQLPGGSYFTSSSWTGSFIAGVNRDNQGYLTVLPWSDPRYIRQEWSSISEGVGTFERWCLFGTWGNWFRNVREGDSVFGWGSKGAQFAEDMFKLPNSGAFYSNPGAGTLNPMSNAAGTMLQVSNGPNSGGRGFQLWGGDNTFLFRGFTNGAHSPARTVYHDGNAVGLTGAGALLESGVTVNGRFTKLADGTLICVATDLPYTFLNASVIANDWTYPHPFVGTKPVVTPVIVGDLATIRQLSGVTAGKGLTLTSSRLAAVSKALFLAADVSLGTFDVVAVGRWKV